MRAHICQFALFIQIPYKHRYYAMSIFLLEIVYCTDSIFQGFLLNKTMKNECKRLFPPGKQ